MPNGEDLVLEESSRQKLDGIVQKMSKNGESDDDIQFVVNDFKNKYGVKKKDEAISESSAILAPSPMQPSKKSGELPSNILEATGTAQVGLTKGGQKQKSDTEIQAEKKQKYNQEKDFEKRAKSPIQFILNEDGSKSTHKMASAEVDGKQIAYPTIVNKNGKLEELSPDEAIDYALKTGEYKEFKTDKEAQQYAEGGYKKGTPLENHEEYLKNSSKNIGENLADWNKSRVEIGKKATSTGELTPEMQVIKDEKAKIDELEKKSAKARSYVAEKNPFKTLIETGVKYVTEDLPEMIKVGASIMSQPTYTTPYGIAVSDKEYEKNPLRWEKDKKENIANVVTDYLSKEESTPKKEYIDQISEVQDGYDFVNYIASTLGKATPQMGATIASSGATSYLESAAGNYISQLQKKSEDTDRPIRDIIEKGDDSPELAQATAAVVATIDMLGVGKLFKGVSGDILKKKVAKSLQQKLLNVPKNFAKGAVPESATEVIQTGVENVSSNIGAGRKAGDNITEGMADAALQGMPVAGTIRAVSGASNANVNQTQPEQSVSEDLQQKLSLSGKEALSSVENRDVTKIKEFTQEETADLVKERTNPKENVLTIAPIQENITLTVPQPTITGTQEQEGTTGVQSVSENVQEANNAVEEGVPISEEREQNKITNEPTKEQNVQTGVLDQSGATDSDTKKGTEQVKESKFNIRQRLGIAVNDALARLADKDRLMYKVLRNSVLLEEADTEIAKDIDAAFESVVAEDNKVSQLAGVFAKAGRLINIFEDAIKNTDDQQAKEFLIEKLDQIRVATQKKATLGGQAVQALSTVGNILPERDMVVLGVIAQREATINKEGLKTIESEATKDVDKAVLMAIDEIVSSDPKIKQLESKIAELEAKIAAGKTTKRKEAVKKAIDKLDSLINNNLAFSDATGTVAIAKQGLIIAREAIKAGNKVVDAIEKAVRFVNAKTGNKKWDEKAFRDAIENSLADIREDLDALYDEKKSLQESKKKLKDSIRTGLQSGDFSDLKSHLTEKGMSEDDMDTYVSDLQDKHEKAVIYAVSKRIDKNLGLTVKRPVEKSLAYIEANSEPLTADEIEARLKNEIDKVSAKVEKLVAKRIEKNTATDEELAEKKKLAELKRLESQKSHEKADKLAMDIFKNEPLTEEEINARLSKKKKELDDKIESERAKRIKKNLETTKEKQLRTERENLERDIREKTTSQIAKKIANSEPLTADEKMSLLKKKNAIEDLTDSEQRRLKELYDEVERVFIDPDLKIEAINNLRHEAQKLIPKTRLSSFLSYYNSNIYYPNILSGGWTSALNLKDAFFNTIDLVPQMRKGGIEAYKDQFKGLKEGLRKAKIGMAEGFVNQGLLNNAEFDKLDLGKKTSEDFAKEGSKIAKYYSKWVGRIMALPNTIGEATKFSALSFVIQKDLESQGFKGRALVDKKNELLYGTFGKREELMPKARKLVYGTENPAKIDAISEAKVQRTVTNMILSDMQEQMTTKEGQEAIEIATQIKDKATYQQTATGILGFLPYAERKLGTMGKSGKTIQEFTRKFLGVEFLNTSMNVANTALDYTPYGYARANDKSVSRGIDAAIKYLNKEGFFVDEIGYSEGRNSEEKARIKEKANKGMALLGGILLTTIARSLSDDDDEKNRMVTGSLKPIDYLNQKTKYQHEKEANLAIPAYSINLPGIGWWNYSGTPLVGVLSIAGNVSDYLYAKKSQDLTWREYGKAIPYGAVNTLKAILIDGTPIGSQIERNKISKNTDAENTESQLGQWMAHKTANMVGGLVPNLIKSLAKDFDSTNYTPDDMAMMVAKSTGVLNMYSAFGGNPNVPYAVDLLGNKISSKSGEKYFNIQKASVSEEDKKIYKLLLDVYKEPSNYPSYINPKMPVFANEIKEKEYKDKLDVIDKLHKKGSITKEGMENRIDALEKESAKIDDIGNDKVLYTKALETCGDLFKRGLQDNYDAIKNMPNDADRRKEVDEILKEAKRLTKAQFAVQPDEEEPTKTE